MATKLDEKQIENALHKLSEALAKQGVDADTKWPLKRRPTIPMRWSLISRLLE